MKRTSQTNIKSSHPTPLCLAAQLCPTLCDFMDYSLPESSVHGDSPVAASRGYSLAAVHGLLIVVAFLVAEHGLGVVSLITFTGLVAPQLVRSSRSRD